MDEQEQLFFNSKSETDDQKVICLGLTFNNDEERRDYFRNELRKKLPQLKKIEGFPIGDDEDIIRLSDPPYYTACPNPWINDLISYWDKSQEKAPNVHVEPFTFDVAEGKNDPAYMAHAYHTKVPSKAIAKFIEHYTDPNDVILDGFSGSGMTGYAVSYLNTLSLTSNQRKVVLNDLSPVASHISNTYNSPKNIEDFKDTAEKILLKIQQNYEWLFNTNHLNKGEIGKINYLIWSEMFSCPTCSEELIYWDLVIDEDTNSFKKTFTCPQCKSELNKKLLEKLYEFSNDSIINQQIKTTKYIPVKINYSFNGKRYEKKLDEYDLETLERIENFDIKNFSAFPIPEGDEISRLIKSYGYTHIHQIYPKRNLIILSEILNEIRKFSNPLLLSWFTSSLLRTTKMYKFTLNRKMGTVSGTYYIPSLWVENIPTKLLKRKLSDFVKVIYPEFNNSIIQVGSQTNLLLNDDSIDYVFTDPPFGENLMYSELNYIWESWLKIFTENSKEAIMNKSQKKLLKQYHVLMFESFKTYYRVLKPNKWMTVVFSNSKSSVWNIIQEAIQQAGFIIANVSSLDKVQGSFKAVTSSIAVKQDLIISAYKPSIESIEKIQINSNTPESAWSFTKHHLEKLPIFVDKSKEISLVVERTPRILFDRMVAYHVQNGLSVPLSSAEFQQGIIQRFPIRDGMAFLDYQIAEYDKKRMLVKDFSQMTLFVSDENSAIEWIRQQLLKKTQTRQDLHPNFMKEIQHIAKHEQLPELDDLLSQNFLRFDDEEVSVPSQILTYLRRNYPDLRGLDASHPAVIKKALHRWYVPDPNKQADLEKLREKALLREFNLYVEEMATSKKKLKVFRTEAIRAGFKKAWSEKEFQTIITVGDRLPETIIQEDDKLLMYYDNAQIKLDM